MSGVNYTGEGDGVTVDPGDLSGTLNDLFETQDALGEYGSALSKVGDDSTTQTAITASTSVDEGDEQTTVGSFIGIFDDLNVLQSYLSSIAEALFVSIIDDRKTDFETPILNGDMAETETDSFMFKTGNGDDFAQAADGGSSIVAGKGNDVILGSEDGSNDQLRGGHGDDVAYGGDGDDLLASFYGQDLMLAGDGNDTIFGSLGQNVIDGGDGIDKLIVDGTVTDYEIEVIRATDGGDEYEIAHLVNKTSDEEIWAINVENFKFRDFKIETIDGQAVAIDGANVETSFDDLFAAAVDNASLDAAWDSLTGNDVDADELAQFGLDITASTFDFGA